MDSSRAPPTPSTSSFSSTTTIKPVESKVPIHKRRFGHLLHQLCPLLSIETGLPHPDFPRTILHYHLLSEEQLDSLAHFYHQRTPGEYSLGYPMPVVARWWAPTNQELEEGEIDEMAEIRRVMQLAEQEEEDKNVATVEDKRRRFGRFLGLRNCESSQGEGQMRREMEEYIARELARREHRDRELESWRSKGYW